MTSTLEGVRQSTRQGTTWRLSIEFTLAAGATKLLGFITSPYTVAFNARDVFSTSEDTLISIYDDVAYTGGDVIAMQNRNRKYKNNPELNPLTDAKIDVSSVLSGLPMTSIHLLYTTKGAFSQGSDQDSAEILLKPSTSHVASITNNDLQTATIGIGAIFRRGEFVA